MGRSTIGLFTTQSRLCSLQSRSHIITQFQKTCRVFFFNIAFNTQKMALSNAEKYVLLEQSLIMTQIMALRHLKKEPCHSSHLKQLRIKGLYSPVPLS